MFAGKSRSNFEILATFCRLSLGYFEFRLEFSRVHMMQMCCCLKISSLYSSKYRHSSFNTVLLQPEILSNTVFLQKFQKISKNSANPKFFPSICCKMRRFLVLSIKSGVGTLSLTRLSYSRKFYLTRFFFRNPQKIL